jgi:hypothetical protein
MADEIKQVATFAKPHIMKKDKDLDRYVIDDDASEVCCLLEAIGIGRVYYAAKRNAYYRDKDFTNPYTDDEIQKMHLPLPIELETRRRKLIEQFVREGKAPKENEILLATMPQVLNPPEEINVRLAQPNEIERVIQRVNRSTLGK